MRNSRPRAFSSEVDTGSREENASKQNDRAPFRFNRNGKGSSGDGGRVTAAGSLARLSATRSREIREIDSRNQGLQIGPDAAVTNANKARGKKSSIHAWRS